MTKTETKTVKNQRLMLTMMCQMSAQGNILKEGDTNCDTSGGHDNSIQHDKELLTTMILVVLMMS